MIESLLDKLRRALTLERKEEEKERTVRKIAFCEFQRWDR